VQPMLLSGGYFTLFFITSQCLFQEAGLSGNFLFSGKQCSQCPFLEFPLIYFYHITTNSHFSRKWCSQCSNAPSGSSFILFYPITMPLSGVLQNPQLSRSSLFLQKITTNAPS